MHHYALDLSGSVLPSIMKDGPETHRRVFKQGISLVNWDALMPLSEVPIRGIDLGCPKAQGN